ncbi:hypothetical protein M1563_03980 [Patescibacteria group bacterium]|nr:hypothetical protein [Patescibacteria group bacterium]MCL5409356.1 hypothetical protein [Patescibacteria group bacterium]
MIDLASVIVEIVVVIISLVLALQKKKDYGFLIATTFIIYVIYDTSRFFQIQIEQRILSVLFLIASLCILLGVYKIYQKSK